MELAAAVVAPALEAACASVLQPRGAFVDRAQFRRECGGENERRLSELIRETKFLPVQHVPEDFPQHIESLHRERQLTLTGINAARKQLIPIDAPQGRALFDLVERDIEKPDNRNAHRTLADCGREAIEHLENRGAVSENSVLALNARQQVGHTVGLRLLLDRVAPRQASAAHVALESPMEGADPGTVAVIHEAIATTIAKTLTTLPRYSVQMANLRPFAQRLGQLRSVGTDITAKPSASEESEGVRAAKISRGAMTQTSFAPLDAVAGLRKAASTGVSKPEQVKELPSELRNALLGQMAGHFSDLWGTGDPTLASPEIAFESLLEKSRDPDVVFQVQHDKQDKLVSTSAIVDRDEPPFHDTGPNGTDRYGDHWIANVYTAPAYRGQGHAPAQIRAAQEIAAERGWPHLWLYCRDEQDGVKLTQFYGKLGFTAVWKECVDGEKETIMRFDTIRAAAFSSPSPAEASKPTLLFRAPGAASSFALEWAPDSQAVNVVHCRVASDR